METSNDFGLAQIGQIAIPVRDLQRAVDFYTNKLGMAYLFTASNLAFFDCGGIRLMLSVPEAAEFDHPSSVIYFRVATIDTAYQTLVARGVQFEDRPHLIANMDTYDLWMAFFRDSEQNLLAIMSEVAHS
jgi:catechol 2,3-dioxygenase-like lactoylglutathione lyase family enzyme